MTIVEIYLPNITKVQEFVGALSPLRGNVGKYVNRNAVSAMTEAWAMGAGYLREGGESE